jgi:hypothetical protein
MLADDINAESGIPFLSVKMCLFVPSLLLSVGLIQVNAPHPKGDFIDIESIDCHIQLIPINSS